MAYEIVITGFRLNAGEPPAQILARVLGLDAANARALVTQRFPVVVARSATLEQARHTAQRLSEAGAKVEVREHAAVAPSAPAAPPRAAPPLAAAPEVASAPLPQTSSGYLLGDLEIGTASSPRATNPQPATPAPSARSSSEDARARRGSSHPQGELAARAVSPPRRPAAPEPAGAAAPDAFAGMQSYGEGFEDLQADAPLPEVDEVVLRSVQRTSPADRAAVYAPPSVGQRLARALRGFGAGLLGWVPHAVALAVVVVISAVAVGYALDPAQPFLLIEPRRIQAFCAELMGSVRAATGQAAPEPGSN